MSNQWYDIDTLQWTDVDTRQWGFSLAEDVSVLYQVCTDAQYVYAATTSGLEIFSVDTEERQSVASYNGGFTTVWASDSSVFVGTVNAGIKKLSKSDIVSGELSTSLIDYAASPDITSNQIRYIHGNSNKLICCTEEGVDIIRRDSNYITHHIVGVGITPLKCFVTPDYDYFYYTLSGSSSFSLNVLNGNTSDWTTSDVVYECGSGFLVEDTSINDFYVTEYTSTVSGGYDNTLFVATDKAVVVYDCGTNESLRFLPAPITTTPDEVNIRKALIFGDYWREYGIAGAYCDDSRIALVYGYY